MKETEQMDFRPPPGIPGRITSRKRGIGVDASTWVNWGKFLHITLALCLCAGCKDNRSQDHAVHWATVGAQSAVIDVMGFASEYGYYPKSIYEAAAQVRGDSMPGSWKERKIAVDPWGNSYRLSIIGDEIRVWSCGPDGIDNNGSGDDLCARFDPPDSQ